MLEVLPSWWGSHHWSGTKLKHIPHEAYFVSAATGKWEQQTSMGTGWSPRFGHHVQMWCLLAFPFSLQRLSVIIGFHPHTASAICGHGVKLLRESWPEAVHISELGYRGWSNWMPSCYWLKQLLIGHLLTLQICRASRRYVMSAIDDNSSNDFQDFVKCIAFGSRYITWSGCCDKRKYWLALGSMQGTPVLYMGNPTSKCRCHMHWRWQHHCTQSETMLHHALPSTQGGSAHCIKFERDCHWHESRPWGHVQTSSDKRCTPN